VILFLSVTDKQVGPPKEHHNMIDSECSHEHMDSYNYSNMTRGVVILQGTQGTLVKGMMLVYTYLAVPFEFDTS
jgi:hypothetical protein